MHVNLVGLRNSRLQPANLPAFFFGDIALAPAGANLKECKSEIYAEQGKMSFFDNIRSYCPAFGLRRIDSFDSF